MKKVFENKLLRIIAGGEDSFNNKEIIYKSVSIVYDVNKSIVEEL